VRAYVPDVRILACIDFSPLSERVVAEASVLARAASAPLVLLAIDRTEPALASGGVAPPGGHRVPPEDTAAHRAELDRIAAAARASGLDVQVEHRLTHAEIPDAILHAATELIATHLVVGSHGHGKLHELVVGSVTQAVIRRARIPVVVVPAGA